MGEVDGGHGFTVVFLCKKSEPIYDSSCVALLKVWCGGEKEKQKKKEFFSSVCAVSCSFIYFIFPLFVLYFGVS